MKRNRTDFFDLWRATKVPLFFLILLLVFVSLDRLVHLPRPNDVLVLAKKYINSDYVYLLIFVAAFIETIPPVNFYFPGSAIVFLSVAAVGKSSAQAVALLSIVLVAFISAYFLNFAIGRFGWSWLLVRCGLGPTLQRWHTRIATRGPKWLWWAYVHPNVGAMAATSCGILRVPFRRFALYSLGATAFWVSFWGFVAYHYGIAVLEKLDIRWLIPLVFTWLLIIIGTKLRRS